MQIGKLQQVSITTEMKKAYRNYAMSVIVARALPDARDGLKPVHRRILFAMHEMNLTHQAKYSKSAKIVGEVMGKYHPHGDMPIYDALVRLAQSFAMRYPLIDGQGNFGSIDGDPPAAMRYCVTGDTLVVTGSGLVPIESVVHKDESTDITVLSLHKKTHKASKWFDSGVNPTIAIKTTHGFQLEGSYNHPVLMWTKNNESGKPDFAWKMLEHILPGDTVVLDRTKDLLWPEDEVLLTAYLPKNQHVRTKVKKLPQTLSKSLAFLLGGLIAEGSLTSKDKIEFCNSDESWITEFRNKWEEVFPDTRLHIFKKDPTSYGKKQYYRIEIHSHFVIAFLRNIGLYANKSAGRRIPPLLLQSPKDVVASFMQAYFEGDGSISSSGRMIELSCLSKSEALIREIQVLLLRFGILATKRIDRHRDIYKLYIRGGKNYREFQNAIGFFSERKNNKLKGIIDTLQKDASLFDYVPYLKNYVYSILDKTLSYDDVRAFSYKHNFDRYASLEKHQYTVATSVLSQLQPDTHALFSKILANNYVFDKIESVTKGDKKKVYSLKVESSCHSFVANGFINHNTEARMGAISAELLVDIDKDTVDYLANFDGTMNEPIYLPAKLPNLLLMGSEGIAVGMATKIPPHNLGEVVDAIVYMIGKTKFELLNQTKKTKGEDSEQTTTTAYGQIKLTSEVTIDELMTFVKGPDFPTAGAIYDATEIKNAYMTGRGKIVIRGKAEIEDIGQGKSAIIVTELPYQVNKALLVTRIADLAKEKKIEGISDLRDESDRRGMRIYIELKRDAVPKKILNNLFKHTALQTTFPVNIVALVDGTPQTLNLKMILEEYLKHRYIVVRRRSEFELRQAKARHHILEGLKIAVDQIDAVIKTIRESKDQEDAKGNLMNKFTLSELQATAILDMQLRRLAALERQKIEDELAMIKETIAYLEDLLTHPEKILTVVKDELKKLREKYADERRTRVFKGKIGEFSDEDLITNEPTVITLTNTGYIKRQSLNSFHTQQRGGKGVRGMTTKEEDAIYLIRFAQTHDNILFFTNKGKVYQIRAFDIGESSRIAKGTAIVNLLNIESGEKVESFISYGKDIKDRYVFLTTRKGTVKKTALKEFENIRRNGIVAIKLDKADELVWSNLTHGEDDVFIVTRDGKVIRFSEKSVRSLGRATMGVSGIKLVGDDFVIGMDVIRKDEKPEFLTLMENGLGKRTRTDLFRGQNRAGQGIKVAKITPKTGKVVVSQIIPANAQEIIITSLKGQVVQLPISQIPKLSRDTQGVILMRFSDKSDKVVSATCIETPAA